MSTGEGLPLIYHGEAQYDAGRHKKTKDGLSGKAAIDSKEVRRKNEVSGVIVAKLPDARVSAMLRLKAGNASSMIYGTDIKKVAEKMIERALRDALGRTRSIIYSDKMEGNS